MNLMLNNGIVGYKHVKTTMIYKHVLNVAGRVSSAMNIDHRIMRKGNELTTLSDFFQINIHMVGLFMFS